MTDIIDRRQRLVAALALSAIDLPAELEAVSRALILSAEACPGLALSDLPPLGPGGRKRSLERARELLDEMLAECEA